MAPGSNELEQARRDEIDGIDAGERDVTQLVPLRLSARETHVMPDYHSYARHCR